MDEGPEAAQWRELVALYRASTTMIGTTFGNPTERMLLEQLYRVTREAASDALAIEPRVYFDHLTQRMYAELTAHVYQERVLESVRVPADWLQAVKERFAPAWLLRRYPMRYREIGAEMFARYPEIHGQGPCVRVMEWKQPLMRTA